MLQIYRVIFIKNLRPILNRFFFASILFYFYYYDRRLFFNNFPKNRERLMEISCI